MQDSSYKPILIAVLALAGLVAFLLSRARLRNGFLLFIAALGLGYRTMPVTEELRIQPADIAIVLVALLSIGAQSASLSELPWWLWGLLPFMFLGWLPNAANPYPWDTRLAECVSIGLAYPVFLAARAVLASKENWRPVILIFYFVGTAVGFLGLLEYFFPGAKHLFAGFMTNTEGIETAEGFRRASFSFYGSTIAAFVCMHALPLGLAVSKWWPGPGARLLTALAAILQVGGIYISGYRSLWLLCALLAALYFLKRRWFIILGLLAAFAFAGLALPDKIEARLETINFFGERTQVDSSGIKRLTRVEEAFQSVLQEPLGRGWAAAGWVHSDFLQVAANLGLVPGLILLAGYLHTLVGLTLRGDFPKLPEEMGALGFPLLLSFVVVGQMLAIQGLEFHSFSILPTWLTWALADTWLRQNRLSYSLRPSCPGTASQHSENFECALSFGSSRFAPTRLNQGNR